MLEAKTIHIAGRTHTLRLRNQDVLVAQQLLPGHMSPLEALARSRDMAAVATCLACALRHEGEGRGKDKKIGPITVCGWLDNEPGKYREAEDAVLEVYEAHYVAIGMLSPGDLTGEAQPAKATESSPATSTFTEPAGGGTSSRTSQSG